MDPFISFSDSNFVSAVSSALGGLFNAPIRLKLLLCSTFPKSHCTTPGDSSIGVPTTTSPSLTLGGTPPPMPTIRPNLIDGKVEVIRVATVADELLPTLP